MAFGLEVFDSLGGKKLHLESRLFSWHSTLTGSIAANATVTITVAGMVNDGTWGIAYGGLGFQLGRVQAYIIAGGVRLVSTLVLAVDYHIVVYRC